MKEFVKKKEREVNPRRVQGESRIDINPRDDVSVRRKYKPDTRDIHNAFPIFGYMSPRHDF